MEGYCHLCPVAGALLVSQWVMKKPLIQRMLGKELTLPQPVWSKLNLAWAVSLSFAVWQKHLHRILAAAKIFGSTLKCLA